MTAANLPMYPQLRAQMTGDRDLFPCGAIRTTMATWIYLSQMALPETAPQTRTTATMETEHLSKPQTKRAFILTWAR